MSALSPRVADDLEARLGRADCDLGEPRETVAAALRELTMGLGRTTEYAVDAATAPLSERPPKQLLVRESLFQHAVTALRAIDVMDRFELALHWKELDRSEGGSGC